jgi:hypothetical protein
MLRRTLLQLTFLLCINCAFSINTSSQDSTDGDGDKLPSNKTELNDFLEDVKKKLGDLEAKDALYETYEKSLQDYRDAMNSFNLTPINESLNILDGLLKSKEKDVKQSVFNEEAKILTTLQQFPQKWNYFDKQEFMSIRNGGFNDKVGYPLGGVFTNPIFSKMQNSHFGLNSNQQPSINTDEDLKNLKDALTPAVFDSEKKKIGDAIDSEKKRVENARSDVKKQISDLRKQRGEIRSKLEEDTQINFLAIKLGLPLFCGTILLLFLGPSILKLIRKSVSDQPASPESKSTLLEISTVLLLTMSILILGLAQRLTGEVLGTLIGGISGYVLNRMNVQNNQPAVQGGNQTAGGTGGGGGNTGSGGTGGGNNNTGGNNNSGGANNENENKDKKD